LHTYYWYLIFSFSIIYNYLMNNNRCMSPTAGRSWCRVRLFYCIWCTTCLLLQPCKWSLLSNIGPSVSKNNIYEFYHRENQWKSLYVCNYTNLLIPTRLHWRRSSSTDNCNTMAASCICMWNLDSKSWKEYCLYSRCLPCLARTLGVFEELLNEDLMCACTAVQYAGMRESIGVEFAWFVYFFFLEKVLVSCVTIPYEGLLLFEFWFEFSMITITAR